MFVFILIVCSKIHVELADAGTVAQGFIDSECIEVKPERQVTVITVGIVRAKGAVCLRFAFFITGFPGSFTCGRKVNKTGIQLLVQVLCCQSVQRIYTIVFLQGIQVFVPGEAPGTNY